MQAWENLFLFLLLEFTTKIHIKDCCYIGTLSWCSIFHRISVCDLISKPIGNGILVKDITLSLHFLFHFFQASIFG